MATPASQTGGCDFPVDPELDAPDAPVFWNPEEAPAVAQYIAPLPTDLQSSSLARLVQPPQTRSEAGLTWARLDDGTVLVGEVDDLDLRPLGILLPLDESWPIRLAAANGIYCALIERTADPPLSRQRRDRLKRALRCVDAIASGASYRDVATAFFGTRRLQAEPWKTSSIKAQVVRLTAYGRKMVGGGYRELLRGRSR
ncbi:DUF2285 domain-containing protein [Rhizobium sp. EC-SD404]|uniref:DUF2285 domain-containing protein n=1 Tax=Rhizobium sp. EC-SD404 TaxID=2038389 RepID=UPI001250D3C9|nr:DUF2285 domain-containing protein [Rhizobium sp. EC-SD404]VVT24634.1 conserved hypothetical protein [Rhizobium sp. EC-SD404]